MSHEHAHDNKGEWEDSKSERRVAMGKRETQGEMGIAKGRMKARGTTEGREREAL